MANLVKINSYFSVNYEEFKIYRKEGRKNVYWAVFPNEDALIRFAAQQCLIKDCEGETLSISLYDEEFKKQLTKIKNIIYLDKRRSQK